MSSQSSSIVDQYLDKLDQCAVDQVRMVDEEEPVTGASLSTIGVKRSCPLSKPLDPSCPSPSVTLCSAVKRVKKEPLTCKDMFPSPVERPLIGSKKLLEIESILKSPEEPPVKRRNTAKKMEISKNLEPVLDQLAREMTCKPLSPPLKEECEGLLSPKPIPRSLPVPTVSSTNVISSSGFNVRGNQTCECIGVPQGLERLAELLKKQARIYTSTRGVNGSMGTKAKNASSSMILEDTNSSSRIYLSYSIDTQCGCRSKADSFRGLPR